MGPGRDWLRPSGWSPAWRGPQDSITVDVGPGEPKHLILHVDHKVYDTTRPNIGPVDPTELRATLSS